MFLVPEGGLNLQKDEGNIPVMIKTYFSPPTADVLLLLYLHFFSDFLVPVGKKNWREISIFQPSKPPQE